MIACPVAAACALACCEGEVSQQPICPHWAHRRRCSHQPPAASHSAQPVPLGATVGSIPCISVIRAHLSVRRLIIGLPTGGRGKPGTEPSIAVWPLCGKCAGWVRPARPDRDRAAQHERAGGVADAERLPGQLADRVRGAPCAGSAPYAVALVPARVKEKVAPSPTVPTARTRPPWRSTICRTLARPTPVPGNSSLVCSRWNGLNSLSA